MSQVLARVADESAARRVHDLRDGVERVLQLAQHLSDADRLMLEQVYRHGMSAAQLATMLGRPPRTIQHRIHMLLRHLRQPLFRQVVARFDLLPREVQRVATLAVLQRCSIRKTACKTGLSVHQVRMALKTIKVLAALHKA